MSAKRRTRSRGQPADARSRELFPIRTVSRLTGVNAITLRAWERRHGLIEPQRSASGQRLYSRENIEVIHRVLELLGKGIAISQVRRALAGAASSNARAPSHWDAERARMLGAVTRFDDAELDEIYDQVLALHSIATVTERLLLPLLVELGQRWESGEGSVCEEHFFSAFLRDKLGARLHHRTRRQGGPRIVAACLPGEQHEFGLLIFTLAALEQGLGVLLLAANTPLQELVRAATRARCAAIVLSATMAPESQLLTEQLPSVVAESPVPVFLGGLASVTKHDAIVAAGVEPLGVDIDAAIKCIQAALRRVQAA
jgi:MerR family transcriptional regulator, light-induced transcriptional regulator